jgi:hypothetical protein
MGMESDDEEAGNKLGTLVGTGIASHTCATAYIASS